MRVNLSNKYNWQGEIYLKSDGLGAEEFFSINTLYTRQVFFFFFGGWKHVCSNWNVDFCILSHYVVSVRARPTSPLRWLRTRILEEHNWAHCQLVLVQILAHLKVGPAQCSLNSRHFFSQTSSVTAFAPHSAHWEKLLLVALLSNSCYFNGGEHLNIIKLKDHCINMISNWYKINMT